VNSPHNTWEHKQLIDSLLNISTPSKAFTEHANRLHAPKVREGQISAMQMIFFPEVTTYFDAAQFPVVMSSDM
jgi:hypothetical protein